MASSAAIQAPTPAQPASTTAPPTPAASPAPAATAGGDRLSNAFAAARAAVAPPAAEGSTGTPAATQPSAAPAAPATEVVVAPAVTSTAEVTEPLKLSWEAVKKAEKRQLEERQRLKAEREAWQKERDTSQRSAGITLQAGQDPIPVLLQLGWTEQDLANHLLNRAGVQPDDNQARVVPQLAQRLPGEEPLRAPQAGQAAPQDQALADRLARIEGFVLSQQYETALRAPGYEVLARRPDALNLVIAKAAQHYELTGESLTPVRAAAIVQDELIADLKASLSDPHVRKAAGLEDPGASTKKPAPAATATSAADDLNSLTNNLTAALPPADRRLTPMERLDRAVKAAQGGSVRA